MPAYLNSTPSSADQPSCRKGLCARPTPECLGRASRSLTIGLVNNMPDAALEATERQFYSLFASASDGISVSLSLYSLPNVPRNEAGARHIDRFYSSVESLWGTELDALIVTGREPLTANLADEPYWESFTRLLEWARDNTYSTVWSCLAAHAATLHMDGIRRVKSDRKHSGVFDCIRLVDHPLTVGTPSQFKLPHSRWNGLSEKELTACGYDVLTLAPDAGIDTFVKQMKSMFVFFQGHPEYEPDTLLREYRRDIGRYLRGEADIYPLMPRDYFDDNTAAALAALEQEAKMRRRVELFTAISELLEKISVRNTWHPTATCIYRNWLQYVCAQKMLRLQSGRATMQTQGGDGSIPAFAAEMDQSGSAIFAKELSDSNGPVSSLRGPLTVL